MPCPICRSCIMRLISIDIDYIEDVLYFSSRGFQHEHDLNPRIGTWKCYNGHEYQLRNTKPCIACTLENQVIIKEEQERSNESNRRRTIGDFLSVSVSSRN